MDRQSEEYRRLKEERSECIWKALEARARAAFELGNLAILGFEVWLGWP